MRILVVLILLAFGYQRQQTTVNGQQTSCTVPESVEGTTLGASTNSATAYTRTVDCCPLSVDFYESQIRIADSLYKNYLPQYNFEEVKAAMEFFDSLRLSKTTDNGQQTTDIFHRIFPNKRQRTICTVPEPVEGTISGASTSSATAYSTTVNCCPLSVDFICAKAHYYHAVGLTEKGDIVGACEHYLIALEIMEPLVETHRRVSNNRRAISVDNAEDYEKIRFVYLIHTRLGEIFYDANFCDLSIINYKKALFYSNILNNNLSTARVLKYIGYSHQLLNQADSALYYYNESLKTSNEINNKLDIEKCIAQVLYYNKGEKDKAYTLLKDNLNKTSNENVKYSYHCLLGNFYYNDKAYDSALYYLEKSLDSNIITQKLAFTTMLSAIYDSLGNYKKRAYYDNISNKLLKNNINNEVEKSKLQNLYNNYNERKTDKIKKEAKVRTVIVGGFGLISVVLLFVYIKCKHKKHSNSLRKEIDNYVKEVENKNCVISEKEQLVKDYHEINVRKDAIIRKQKKELYDIKHKSDKLDKKTKLDRFYKSDICENILKREGMDLMPLTENELQLLITTANYNLDNLIARLFDEFPKLTTIDMYCICLVVLLNNNTKIAYMLDRNRKTIWERINRIKNIIGLDIKEDLFLHIIENYI